MPACQLNLLNDQFDNGGIVNELIGFSHNGNQTLVEERRGIPFLWNEFWTARQRQSHKIHEISYRACFKAQLPEFFISRLTSPGDTVYDPFMGRGTTPIQAALMGRKAIGVDINPLSVALTEPRLLQQRLSDIEERLKNIDWSYSGNVDDELLVFFHRETLKQIYALRSWFLDRKESNQLDPTDLWIRMVAINRLTGHSPGFFSVYTMPPNQAVTVDTQKKINMRRAQIPQKKDVPSLILKKSYSLLKDGPITESPGYTLMVASANSTPKIDATSVDLVVTSPPFLDVVQYADDNWLRCWFLNIDPTTVPISIHKRPEEWIKFARGVFKELGRVIRPDGHIAFEVGEVRNGSVELEDLVLSAIKGLPLTPLCVVVNSQIFTKTSNCWGVKNNKRGTNTNRIVLMRRHTRTHRRAAMTAASATSRSVLL